MPYIRFYCVTTSSRFIGSMENYRNDAHQLIPLKHTVTQLKSRFLLHSLSHSLFHTLDWHGAQFVYRNAAQFVYRFFWSLFVLHTLSHIIFRKKPSIHPGIGNPYGFNLVVSIDMPSSIWAIQAIATSLLISGSPFIRTERISFSQNFHNTVSRCYYVVGGSLFVPHTPITA